MNVVPMMQEILSIPNPVIRKSALPDLASATDRRSQSIGISSLDQLNSMLKGDVSRRSD